MAQEREPSDRLTEEESGQDVHHGGQQEAAEEEGVQQEASQGEDDQQIGPEHPATGLEEPKDSRFASVR